MKNIQDFTKFFHHIGELCFHLGNVERPLNLFNFTNEKNQIINHEFFVEVTERHPDASHGFYVSFRKRGEFLQFFLMKDFSVVLEYCNLDAKSEIKKTVKYISIREAKEDILSHINYLTMYWDPLKKS